MSLAALLRAGTRDTLPFQPSAIAIHQMRDLKRIRAKVYFGEWCGGPDPARAGRTRGGAMELKEAVARAKAYVADLFADEPIMNIALEEVERDDVSGAWRITIGFGRTFSQFAALARIAGAEGGPRVYRVVTIKDDGSVVSVKRRDNIGD